MTKLFTSSKKNISEVIHYNIDMTTSAGYRIKSKTAIRFQIWATEILRQSIVDGYAINKELFNKNKTVISMLNRDILNEISQLLQIKLLLDFSIGLNLLDDYDRNNLDNHGNAKSAYRQIT
ncbi:MAG: virulence RhuM family protein [Holosporales bacterium]|jgi:hypothetical protein|nr:virulence RhuM family protein [Holosporales bacterium]